MLTNKTCNEGFSDHLGYAAISYQTKTVLMAERLTNTGKEEQVDRSLSKNQALIS